MKEKAPAHFARNDGRREGCCRGMKRGHDVLRFHEGARRARCIVPLQEPEKTRGGKNRGTSSGLLASEWRGEFRLRTSAGKFLLKSMDY